MSAYRNDRDGITGLTIFGSDLADIIVSSRRDDRIEAGDGDDTVRARPGDDDIVGGLGDDTLRGGRGDDTFTWNNGDGSDLVNGGRGYDRQVVNLADGPGDTVEITNFGSLVQFERTNLGNFTLDLIRLEELEVNGLGGDDTVAVQRNVANRIELILDGGADGADHRHADDAHDIEEGDTIDFSEFRSGVRVDLDENNQGVLQAENDLSNATRTGLSEFGVVSVDDEIVIDQLDDFENVIGTEFDDTIFGNTQNNVLLGGEGNDALHPFGGADFVDGGAGTDLLLLNGFPKGSLVDLVAGSAAFIDGTGGLNTLANIENVNGSTVAGDIIIGDDRTDIEQGLIFVLNNVETVVDGNLLNGLGGDDILLGGGGNDRLIGGENEDRARADATGSNADALNGGLGNDFLTGGSGADRFGFAASEGPDVVEDFEIGEDQIVLDAPSFGVRDHAAFQNVAREGGANDDPAAGLVGVQEGKNVYVLQGVFENNAGGAADALAEALAGGVDEGSGFFVYFNTGQNIQRLVHVDDLDNVDSGITLIANLGESNPDASTDEAAAVRDSLANFAADNFSFDFSVFDDALV